MEGITGYSRGTIQTYKSVADNTSLSRRKDLSFEHHRQVAPLEPEQQKQFLQKASEEKLSVRELRNMIAEQKLRTQRILGNLIKLGQEAGEINKPETFTGNQYLVGNQMGPTKRLSDIGLTKKQSSTFQRIFDIPDDDFEEFIHEKKEAVLCIIA